MATHWPRTLSSCRDQSTDSARSDAGITLVELMIAIVLMSVVFVGVLAYFQLAMAANLRVTAQAAYSQELSLMASFILDGSDGRYRGLRQAKDVQVSQGHDYTAYTFIYGGSDAGHSETYWSSNGRLYRSRGAGTPEEMGSATGLQIAAADGIGKGVYSLVITGATGAAGGTEYAAYVRLRNYSP